MPLMTRRSLKIEPHLPADTRGKGGRPDEKARVRTHKLLA